MRTRNNSPQMGVTFDPFTRGDIFPATELIASGLGNFDAAWAHKHFNEYAEGIRAPYEVLLMARNFDKQQVAVCGLFQEQSYPPGWVALHWFAVDEKFRGRGIGQACIEECERRANGFRVLFAHAEPSAVGFYKKTGFKLAEDVLLNPKIEGTILMAKHLFERPAKNFYKCVGCGDCVDAGETRGKCERCGAQNWLAETI